MLTKLIPAQPHGYEATRATCNAPDIWHHLGANPWWLRCIQAQTKLSRDDRIIPIFRNGTRNGERELTMRREWWWWGARGGRDGGGRSGGRRGARPFPPPGTRRGTTRAGIPAGAAPPTAGPAAPATASGAPALAAAAKGAPQAPPRGSRPCTARTAPGPREPPPVPARRPDTSRLGRSNEAFGGGSARELAGWPQPHQVSSEIDSDMRSSEARARNP